MKVGIIGCGKIAQTRHIPEYLENPRTEICGFYDWNQERAASLAQTHGGIAYGSIDAMLADQEIEAVSVCTANNSHADISVKALQAGKHVLCEKPMATSLPDCERMIKAADAAGKVLMIGQNQRFLKTHIKAKELLDAGTIGKVLTFRTVFGHCGPECWSIDPGAGSWFFNKEQAGLGAMADLGVHKTDLIQYLLGQKIIAVTARTATLDKQDADGNRIGVEDNGICIYEMEQGTIGTMTASWSYYGEEDNSTVFYGTRGIMKLFTDPVSSIIVITDSGARMEYEMEQIQTNEAQGKTGIIDAFVDAVNGGNDRSADAVSVLGAMRAVFAGMESSEKMRRIVI